MGSHAWWAKGVLLENCSCALLCRAHVSFKQRCDGDACIGHWAAHISEGRFDSVSLAGLNLAVLYDAPPVMYEGNWTQRLYLDERADDAQRSALESILAGRAGGPWATLGRFVATRLETRCVPVLFEDMGSRKRITVPGVFDTTVAAIQGGDRDGPAILSNLYNVVHGLVHVLARGTTRCHDDRIRFTHEKTHGLYSDFSWQGSTEGEAVS